MKRILLSLVLFLFISTSCLFNLSAQNLVLNPSFENTTACPQGISQFNLAVDWAQGNSGADSCTTSDLYAGCTPSIGGSNSPNGLLGYQASRTGTHHAGFIAGDGFPGLGCALFDNYREYIEGHTSSPLVAGQKYLVRFYVSLAEGGMAGTDDIGLYFSNSYYSHNACGNQIMPVTPQLNYCGPALMDTLNWTEVRWIYTATGGESYFTIGNFKSNANTSVTPLNCNSFNPYLYYYIDDVEISPVPQGTVECAFSLVTTTTKAGCANNNGIATVEVQGCTSPFNYTWSNGSHASTLNGLSAATYTVTVSDNTACSSTIAATVGIYTPPTLQMNTINSSCTSNTGTVIANVLVGTGPYTYQWNNSASTQVINNLGAGTYNVTVTGAGVCSASASASITASLGNLTLNGSATSATCGNINGTATVGVTGGAGPFNFLWSNAQTTQSISNLAPGTYTVTVAPSTTVVNTPFFTEYFTGGVGGWTFADGPGTNGAQPNQWVVNNNTDCDCHAGNYLHITCNSASFTCFGNAGACTYFTGSPIPNPLFGDPTADKLAISPIISTVGKTNMVLKFKYQVGGDAGNDYGQLRFSNNGGTTWTDMPALYTDSTICTQATVNVPNNFENIANFRIAFRWINNQDGNGNDPGFAIDSIQLLENSSASCPSITSVTVAGSSALTLNATSTSANCGQNNGTATVTVNGTGNYTYLWNNSGNTASVSNLPGGTYTVTVSEGVNCSSSASVTILSTAGLNVSASATNATCGNNNGTAAVTVNGTGTYSYAWSNSGNTASINNLAAGSYNVTVTQSGCSATASAVVVASAGLSASFIVTQPSCGQANGSLNCSNIVGGAQPLNTTWSLNSTVISTNPQIGNLGSGTYVFHAADANACSLDTIFVLNSTGVNSATITANQTTMCASDSAIICAPAGYASYLWNTGGTGLCITATHAGNYYVTVTDNGNCTASSNHLAINVYPLPAVSISVNGDTMTAFNATSYQWYLNGTTILNATSNVYVATQTGNYTVAVSDANGCVAFSNPVNISTVGIHELVEGQGMKVYPNPLDAGFWTLECGANMVGGNAEIFDDNGRLVYQSKIQSIKSAIEFNAARGIYFLRLFSAEHTATLKLIKL